MARDVRGLVVGMQLLEPGFEIAAPGLSRVGRLRLECHPQIEAALDRALRATGWDVVDVALPEWEDANAACALLLVAEAWESNRSLAERHPDKIGRDVLERLESGREVGEGASLEARATAEHWRLRLEALFDEVQLLATPTLAILPPLIAGAGDLMSARSRCTLPANLAGVPALALPVPTSGLLPASLQLIAPLGREEQLLGAGLVVEDALRSA